MKKIVIHKAGGYDKLKVEEGPSLTAKEDEIVVDVKFSGVNYADVCVRWGIYESAKQYVGWPITPGFEFSGVVKEIGNNVSGFQIGDEVFGVTFFNAYANEVVVPKHQLFKVPKNLSMEQAATFPAVFMTAYHGLFQHFILRPNMKVLVHSSAGGVGSALVQLLKDFGCYVVGVIGSSHKMDHAKEMGADEIIDKSKQNLWSEAKKLCPEGYDVILDANGVKTIKDSFNHLKPTGKLVVYGFHTMLPKGKGTINIFSLVYNYLKTPRFSPIELTSLNKSVIAFNLSFLFERKDLLEEAMTSMIKMVEENRIKGLPVKVFDYTDVGGAHAHIESANSIGKIAIKW